MITFGAPAVGNKYLPKIMGEKLDLARIVMAGDPIRNLAQILIPIINCLVQRLNIHHYYHMMINCGIKYCYMWI